MKIICSYSNIADNINLGEILNQRLNFLNYFIYPLISTVRKTGGKKKQKGKTCSSQVIKTKNLRYMNLGTSLISVFP